jgi:hypothetical protein
MVEESHDFLEESDRRPGRPVVRIEVGPGADNSERRRLDIGDEP